MAGDTHDFVIKGGTVIDGTGRPSFQADVAVTDGRISHVGPDPGPAKRVYDADGLTVIPGFVDVHTHFDGQATWDNRLLPSSEHGVTTVIAGNCGVGFAPAHVDGHDRLIDFMEGVEDIPGTALHEGISWEWETFSDFLATLDSVPHDADLGVYLPHCPLRIYVMGERARSGVEATGAEIAAMASLVREAVLDGAMGFSTSRTINHRTVAGEHIPTLSAASSELLAIARSMGETGRGIIQLTTDFNDPEAEFAMMRRLSVESGRPLSFSLVQEPGTPDRYRLLLDLLADAVRAGVPMRAQVPARGVGLVMGLDSSLNPYSRNSAYLEIDQLPLAEKLAAMREPGFLPRLLEADRRLHETGRTEGRLLYDYDRIFELGDPPDYEPGPENSIGARAARERVNPAELMYRLLTRGDGSTLLYAAITNAVPGRLDVVGEMLQDPNTVVGLSDAGAHVGLIVDGSFPTTLLGYWGRDRADGTIPLERLVRKQTSETAGLVGLDDRGRLEVGLRADINVVDMSTLRPHRPRVVHDLPAGGRRFLQGADGYRHTFVAGVETYRDGEPTGELPGRLVRGRPFTAVTG
ncbi:N-acyl-D-amino-acid deacylase family protein [Pseudofrankia inefficax]|uniref:Amidohydrolase 3 n=1 Tax=Pseudofrankia inefficax (strain DSM 45817 / CECT 9037 / DDB 130130 / EuI1c) TaxID=298654 RepID=E3J928_PSEI1|nr:amidohydrolase family protein [Pseudofrankia inefficax]ADP80907.1 Amidohydrolase 3 [Pseudofrankia inefficax]